jgi:hypothetical protein
MTASGMQAKIVVEKIGIYMVSGVPRHCGYGNILSVTITTFQQDGDS